MPKIAFLGAGAFSFTRRLVADVLLFDELRDSEIALMDIHERRLKTADVVCHKIAEALNLKTKITATLDRRKALDGADYVFDTMKVGFYEPCTVTDFEIPKRYGLRQTIGDTLGIGGIFRGLRSIPVLMALCKEMEELCPDAWLLNYSNPMAINTGAVLQRTKIKAVGLCHGIQGSIRDLAKCFGLPEEEINYVAAGVNHCSWFLKLEHKGEDLYPRLKQLIDEPEFADKDQVRFEMLRKFGYYGGESSEHLSEYVPYFIRKGREELLERFGVPLDEHPRRMRNNMAKWAEEAVRLEDPNESIGEVNRSSEYGSLIIHSIETGTPRVIHGNILNRDHITNLPSGACVEVPCLVDRNGVQGTVVGALPAQCAALVMTNLNVHLLTQKAAETLKKEDVYRAALLDPLTKQNLTMDETVALCDDLIAEHGDWLPRFG